MARTLRSESFITSCSYPYNRRNRRHVSEWESVSYPSNLSSLFILCVIDHVQSLSWTCEPFVSFLVRSLPLLPQNTFGTVIVPSQLGMALSLPFYPEQQC